VRGLHCVSAMRAGKGAASSELKTAAGGNAAVGAASLTRAAGGNAVVVAASLSTQHILSGVAIGVVDSNDCLSPHFRCAPRAAERETAQCCL
jgi:hypothetical protein